MKFRARLLPSRIELFETVFDWMEQLDDGDPNSQGEVERDRLGENIE